VGQRPGMSLEVVGSLGVVERHLTRYWIELDFPDGYPPHATRLGIGVTAFRLRGHSGTLAQASQS
jgi:hypothetical protein